MLRVFVYGTLKQGFPNFGLNKGVRCRGSFVTRDKYPLYLIGERYSPWLVLNKGTGTNVKGQVFEISQAILTAMDRLERTDKPDGYRRITTRVICIESGEQQNAFMYGKPIVMLASAEIRSKLAGQYLPEHSALYRSRNSRAENP